MEAGDFYWWNCPGHARILVNICSEAPEASEALGKKLVIVLLREPLEGYPYSACVCFERDLEGPLPRPWTIIPYSDSRGRGDEDD